MSATPDPRVKQARQVVMRAWRDEEYRNGLPAEVREKIPPRPEGASKMTDEELEAAAGGVIGLAAVGAAAGIAGAVATGFGAGVALEQATD